MPKAPGSNFIVQHWTQNIEYPDMKLHVKITANRRITNIEPQNFEG